jgi:ferredoxin-type protein NapH
MINTNSPKTKPSGRLWPAAYILGFFLAAGACLRWLEPKVPYHIIMATIGLCAAAGFLLHRALPARLKRIGRSFSLLSIGLGLFLGAGLFGRQNEQIEGFLFDVFLGVLGAGLAHYLVAKLIGPLFVGRLWCGWGCWTFALLNHLPYKAGRPGSGRAPFSRVRVIHFALSFALVAVFVFGLRYVPGTDWKTTRALTWYLAGNAFYFIAGILLAFIYKDNRAFCKILCPISVVLKIASRASLLKIGPTAAACNACGACSKVCPMAVDVSGYISAGRRVRSTECVLCRQCVAACPRGACDLSLGFDFSS